MTIDEVLTKAPSKISYFAERENKAYGDMIIYHEEYKRVRAKKYLERRAKEGTITVKDMEYWLDTNEELQAIKDKELLAEIDYRGHRQKKDHWDDLFNAAMERARNKRTELRNLKDTIGKEG